MIRFFVIVFISLTPALALGESLNKTLLDAYTNSNLLAQNRAILRASDEDVGVALSSLRPIVTSKLTTKKADYSRAVTSSTLSSSVSISADLLIFDSGNKSSTFLAKKQIALGARQALKALEQNIFLEAIKSRLAVTRDIEILSLRIKNVKLINQELLAVKDRFEVGEVTRTEVAQAEARLAQAKSSLVEADGNLAISKELFMLAVGRYPGDLIKLKDTLKLPETLSDAVAYGLEYHPDILRIRYEVKANEYKLSAARGSFGPSMSVGAQLGDSTSYDLNGSVSLTINLPLYKGGQLNSLLRKAYSAVHASKANLRQQGLVVHKNIAQSWSQLSVSKAQLSSNERQISAAEIAFFGVREEANLGARTTLEVLDAEQVLFDAQTNRVILETQSQLAGYQLLASSGKLTAKELNIDLENFEVIDYSNSAHKAPSIFSKEGRKLSQILKRYSN